MIESATMPDPALARRIAAVVETTCEPDVRRYLEEAYKCFMAEAYSAAVVMAWNAVACHMRHVVEKIGEAFFAYHYSAVHKGNPPKSMRDVHDSHLVTTCKRMGVLPSDPVHIAVDTLRNRRNDCAHPTGLFASEEELVDLLDKLCIYLRQSVSDVRLSPQAALEFIMDEEQNEQEILQIVAWVHESHCEQLAHHMLTMFLTNEDVDTSRLEVLWKRLWERVDDEGRRHLWVRLEHAVQQALDDENRLRTPEDLLALIVWPSPEDSHEVRDCIGELYLSWLEKRLEQNDFAERDMKLARELRQYLPANLRTRANTLWQEMIRRYQNDIA